MQERTKSKDKEGEERRKEGGGGREERRESLFRSEAMPETVFYLNCFIGLRKCT